MCIICVKNKNSAMPSSDIITQMWESNPDGAGMCWSDGNKVHIEKGFMSLDKLLGRLNNLHDMLTESPVILHFRIATHGRISPQNTHPFPISDNIKELTKRRYTTDLAIAHNGVIDIVPRKGISDTMEYIMTRLYPIKKKNPLFYQNELYLDNIEREIRSKMAIMNGYGNIKLIGKFTVDNGIYYSNSSYKAQKYCKIFSTEQELMPLYNGYLIMDGLMYDLDEDMFFMDNIGNVYGYDEAMDIAFLISENGQAYTYNGTPICYEKECSINVSLC